MHKPNSKKLFIPAERMKCIEQLKKDHALEQNKEFRILCEPQYRAQPTK